MASPQSLEQLTAALAAEYDAPDQEVRAAVEEMVAALRAKGLLAAGGTA
ncbi:MAG: PqqD family protein [Pseudomonadota bacterium]